MRLEEPDRSTVLQRYLDGLSASDIARARGESPAAVRKRLSRATAKLRAMGANAREVLAFATAPQAQGGIGATLVWLRRNRRG